MYSSQADAEAALAAIRDLNGVSIDGGKPISVSKLRWNLKQFLLYRFRDNIDRKVKGEIIIIAASQIDPFKDRV